MLKIYRCSKYIVFTSSAITWHIYKSNIITGNCGYKVLTLFVIYLNQKFILI